jgi:serine/threonine protein kinase
VTGAMRAVKVVYREDFSDQKTFEREFEGILRFEPISRNHQGFVNILHVGRSDDLKEFYYYVMELGDDAHEAGEINPVEYEPRTLRSDMKKANGAPLATDFCIETGHRLAEALQELHERGLTHRDVKPSNVIFVDGKAKLADIGLVAAKNQRTFVGTEGFVPPEGPGSDQADIYSLGKVLYEMATGMDRLQFPELPDDGPGDDSRKDWIRLNRLICDICEPRVSKRKITTGFELAEALGRLKQGRAAPRKVPAYAPVLAGILALLALIGSQFWIEQSWGTHVIEGNRKPLPPRFVMVKVLTTPVGAEVYDADYNLLGYTPVTLTGVEIDSLLELNIKSPGYRDESVSEVVKDNGKQMVPINKTLSLFSPPIAGLLWTDALGNRYFPEGERNHRSSEHVSERHWSEFLKATGKKMKPVVFKYGGRPIVAVREEWAAEYTVWLKQKCIEEGYFERDIEDQPELNLEMVPIYDLKFDERKLPAAARKNGKAWRPFFCLVRPIPYGSLRIDSTPSGAALYLNRILVGETPYVNETTPVGDIEIRLELGGKKTKTDNIYLSKGEDMRKSYQLEENESFVPGESWTNSLDMKLVPLNENLSVAIWETRSGDFNAFLKARKRERGFEKPDGIKIDEVDPNVPVAGVSRKDCEEFCEWLTKREGGNPNPELNRIYGFRYRLPTDREWSQMVGLVEVNESLVDREMMYEGQFPWGTEFPPPDRTGNFADTAAAEIMDNSRTIAGYTDGFQELAPVGSFRSNVMGIYDLDGNVREWVSDTYPDLGFGVLRGGSWADSTEDKLESRLRYVLPDFENQRESTNGFRVVLAKDVDPIEESEEDTDDGGD